MMLFTFCQFSSFEQIGLLKSAFNNLCAVLHIIACHLGFLSLLMWGRGHDQAVKFHYHGTGS